MSKWNLETLTIEATNHVTRFDMYRNKRTAYNAAKELNLLDQLFPVEGVEWNEVMIRVEAKKYKTRSEFHNGSRSAYDAASELNILDKLFVRQRHDGAFIDDWMTQRITYLLSVEDIKQLFHSMIRSQGVEWESRYYAISRDEYNKGVALYREKHAFAWSLLCARLRANGYPKMTDPWLTYWPSQVEVTLGEEICAAILLATPPKPYVEDYEERTDREIRERFAAKQQLNK